MDFVALDVETANPDMASIFAIGLCRFEGGQLVGSTRFLVDPQDRFDPMHVAIHGIRAADVAGSPPMADVLPIMARALVGRVVVHHGHFDRVAVAQAASRCGLPPLDATWLNTVPVARRAWPALAEEGGHGLRNLARAFGIDLVHHDPREDARAAGLLLVRAAADTGLDLSGWLARVRQRVNLSAPGIAQSGDPSGPLRGERVAFTGSLTIVRAEAARFAAAAGCDVDEGVTRRTTILVVGDQDVRVVGPVGKSAKHIKAEGMVARGAALRIIGESDFQELVRLG